MSKLEKCREELERARKRYEYLGNKIKKLEVHGMMVAAELTPEQLARLIRMAKTGELYFEKMEEKIEEEMLDEE